MRPLAILQSPLGAGQFGLRLLVVPRGFHHLPHGGDQEVGVGAEVYSNSVLVFRKRPGFHLATENDVPVLAFPLDRSGLEPAFQGAVELAFDRADAVEEHPLPPSWSLTPVVPAWGKVKES